MDLYMIVCMCLCIHVSMCVYVWTNVCGGWVCVCVWHVCAYVCVWVWGVEESDVDVWQVWRVQWVSGPPWSGSLPQHTVRFSSAQFSHWSSATTNVFSFSLCQAFINTAKEIYEKIQEGVFDINNEVTTYVSSLSVYRRRHGNRTCLRTLKCCMMEVSLYKRYKCRYNIYNHSLFPSNNQIIQYKQTEVSVSVKQGHFIVPVLHFFSVLIFTWFISNATHASVDAIPFLTCRLTECSRQNTFPAHYTFHNIAEMSWTKHLVA